MSKLYFRYGAMNSGKSTALLQVAHNYEERGMCVAIIKREFDSKGGNNVVSRLNVMREVDYVVHEDTDIYEMIKNSDKKVDCILVDEAQFLTEEHVNQLYELAVLENIPVICYGLRTDFKTDGFPGSARLLLLAHSLEELKTICTCGRKALHNSRKVNNEFVFDGDQVVIDNDSKIEYVSLCPICFYEKKSLASG